MTNEELDLMSRFADKICDAKFIPEQFRGDSASVLYQIATAEELGIGWMHGLRSTFPNREGSLGMKGDIILGLLLSKGFKVDFSFTEDPIGCTCTIIRPEEKDQPLTDLEHALWSRTFTMIDAARIEYRWLPEQNRWATLAEHPFYKNYSSDMCQWRALTRCARVRAANIDWRAVPA